MYAQTYPTLIVTFLQVLSALRSFYSISLTSRAWSSSISGRFKQCQVLSIVPASPALSVSLVAELPVIISATASLMLALTLETDTVRFDPRAIAQVGLNLADAFPTEEGEARRLSLHILVPSRPSQNTATPRPPPPPRTRSPSTGSHGVPPSAR
ncbi:hypothetical protein C8R43DRAFT_1116383 [Mycena crocata]|nr:hypothetical protein C8R43DRAFT_1116383 [Mycena crocata]